MKKPFRVAPYIPENLDKTSLACSYLPAADGVSKETILHQTHIRVSVGRKWLLANPYWYWKAELPNIVVKSCCPDAYISRWFIGIQKQGQRFEPTMLR
eukprot:8077228-Pyramimonas_sp.AAC.1